MMDSLQNKRQIKGGEAGVGGEWKERGEEEGDREVQLADEIMLISIISFIVIVAHAPVLSNLI